MAERVVIAVAKSSEKKRMPVDDFLWGAGLVFVLALSLLAIGPLFAALPKPSTIPTVTITCPQGNVESCVFSPSALSVQSGRSLLVSSQGTYSHTFTSRLTVAAGDPPEPLFHLDLNGEDAKALQITYQPGAYEYFCKFHSWMTGSITIA